MSNDLSNIFDEWEYDPEDTMRIITASDGRRVLQVRLPLGIEQYELDGRPDGNNLFGKETVLAEYEGRLERHVETKGSEKGFFLDHEDSLLLQNEGVLFYYRYLLLFQLNDFERVSRDTAHNLRICELMERFAEDDEDKTNILQYKPYILRMNAMARAMTSIQGQLKEAAQSILEKAIEEINGMQEVDSPAFQFEKIRSVNYLNKALKQIQKQEPDPARKLEIELEEAVAEEDYERAAELRDKLKEMK